MPVRSVRYSTLPPFTSLDGLRDVERDRAGLGVRHLARGPEHAAELADLAHHVRRGDRDVEVGEALLHALGEVRAADDVGAGGLGLAGLVALGEHRDGDRRPVPCGSAIVPRKLLVGVTDVDAEAEVHLDRRVELAELLVLDRVASRRAARRACPCSMAASASRYRFPCFGIRSVSYSASTVTPMLRAVPAMTRIAASMSFALRSGIFCLGDLAELIAGEVADLGAVRLGRALVQADRLLDQHRGGRGLRDERERAVLEDRDLDGDDRAGVALRLRVERLAELRDVDAGATERRADRRGRRSRRHPGSAA